MSRNINIRLPKPHKNQLQVLKSKARFKVLLCGRRWGKSVVSQIAAINKILEGKFVAYITPTYSLAKVFFEDLLKVLPAECIKSANISDLEIKLITGGVITFFTGERLNNLRGRKFHLVIIDEAAFIPSLKENWNSAIRPTLTDFSGDAIIVSTPRGKEFFYSLVTKGLNKDDGFETFHFTSYDNPFLSVDEINSAKESLPLSIFNQEYLAIATENASNPFGTSNIQNNTIQTLSNKPVVVYGIDLAKHSDYSVIVGLDEDATMAYYERFQLSWDLTKNKIVALPSNIPLYIDSTGVGDVIVEDLQLLCNNVNGYKFTNQSKNNLILKLIKDVELGKVKYNQVTADEMAVFEYKLTNTGNVTYSAMSGYNDDSVIALALANYHLPLIQGNKNWGLHLA